MHGLLRTLIVVHYARISHYYPGMPENTLKTDEDKQLPNPFCGVWRSHVTGKG